jgi:hypothetical protein
MDLGLPENIIKVGGVREHGRRIKVEWERGVSREDGTPKLFSTLTNLFQSNNENQKMVLRD